MTTEIKSAEQIEINTNGYKITSAYKIVDIDVWNRSLINLTPLLGRMIVEEYGRAEKMILDEDYQNEIRHQLQLSLKGIDTIYIESYQDKILGFCALEQIDAEKPVKVVREIIVDKTERGKGVGGRLYTSVCQNEDFWGLLGYSKTPAAVHLRLKVAQALGLRGCFGDASNGKEEKYLREKMREYLYHERVLSDKPCPEGFLYLKGESGLLPKLDPNESKFHHPDPLFLQFRQLQKLQEQNPTDTAVGILVTINPNFNK